MIESEVKILDIDSGDVQKRLEALGATKTFSGPIVWVVFDLPDNSLSKNEVILRLRKKGDGAELAYKKLISTDGSKKSEEFEVTTNSFEETAKIIAALGYKMKQGYPMKKDRISFSLGELHIDIDTLDELPTFMEIEGNDIAQIEKLAADLGFSKDQLKPWGLREVYNHYRKLGLVT